jgi:hypothetical protein
MARTRSIIVLHLTPPCATILNRACPGFESMLGSPPYPARPFQNTGAFLRPRQAQLLVDINAIPALQQQRLVSIFIVPALSNNAIIPLCSS